MEQVIGQLSQKGHRHLSNKKYAKAHDYFNMAILCILETGKGQEEMANLRYHLGVSYLKNNIYDLGFSNYIYVTELPSVVKYDFYNTKERVVDNTRITNKRVLMYTIVSMDFLILFCRFIPEFIRLHVPKQVIVEVPEYLVPVVSNIPLLSGCTITHDINDDMFDCHMEMSTLPLFVGINSSYETKNHLIPYIFPDEKLVKKHNHMLESFVKKTDKVIMLNWKHNPIFENKGKGELDDEYIRELTQHFSFIKFLCPHPEVKLPTIDNLIINTDVSSYDKTISLASIVDTIITTCTFFAHVSAAMGCRVLLLLEQNHEWEWNNSNWYPNVVVFKQQIQGDWRSVFMHLKLYLHSQI